MKISDMQHEAWQIAEDKGFHTDRDDDRDDALVRLCLVHSEVSEAVQEVKRHGVDSPEALNAIETELADVLIRIGDFCGCYSLDLEAAVIAKLAANAKRPRLFGTPFEGHEKGTM